MKVKLKCLSCGKDGESNCCADPRLVKAAEYAAQAVRDNPGMSMRYLVDKTGLGIGTIHRAKQSAVPNGTPEKVTGKDGKSYKATKPATRKRGPSDAIRQAIARDVIDNGKTGKQVCAEYGVSSTVVRGAIAKEKGRREAPIEPADLPKTAQQKLDAAIRQAVRRLEAEFEQRLQSEIKQRIDDTILPHYNKKMEEFDEVIKARKGVLTNSEFRLILSCLHPDLVSGQPLKDRFARAFNCVKSHEISLRGEKEMPTSSFVMPRNYADLMKMREEVAAKRRAQKHVSKNLPGLH